MSAATLHLLPSLQPSTTNTEAWDRFTAKLDELRRGMPVSFNMNLERLVERFLSPSEYRDQPSTAQLLEAIEEIDRCSEHIAAVREATKCLGNGISKLERILLTDPCQHRQDTSAPHAT